MRKPRFYKILCAVASVAAGNPREILFQRGFACREDRNTPYHNILLICEHSSCWSNEELIPWTAYLQLAHFKGAFSLGQPYRSHEGFEHVINVLFTVSGSPDMRVGFSRFDCCSQRHRARAYVIKPVQCHHVVLPGGSISFVCLSILPYIPESCTP